MDFGIASLELFRISFLTIQSLSVMLQGTAVAQLYSHRLFIIKYVGILLIKLWTMLCIIEYINAML